MNEFNDASIAPNAKASPAVESDLFETLWSMEYRICGNRARAKEFARDFLRRHAHELGEKIREAAGDVNHGDGLAAARWDLFNDAANMIDPEEEV